MRLDEAQLQIRIIQDYVPVGNHNRPGDKLTATSITIHNTDNEDKGANAAVACEIHEGPRCRRSGRFHGTSPSMIVLCIKAFRQQKSAGMPVRRQEITLALALKFA